MCPIEEETPFSTEQVCNGIVKMVPVCPAIMSSFVDVVPIYHSLCHSSTIHELFTRVGRLVCSATGIWVAAKQVKILRRRHIH